MCFEGLFMFLFFRIGMGDFVVCYEIEFVVVVGGIVVEMDGFVDEVDFGYIGCI